MAEAATKFALKNEDKKLEPLPPATRRERSPFDRLRSEIDRLFDDFGVGPWRSTFRRGVFDAEPFWYGELSWGKVPAVDIAETEKGYEITAELPGIDRRTWRSNTLTTR